MNQARKTCLRAFGLAALATNMALVGLPGVSAQTQLSSLDEGTVIPVKLDDPLNSKDAQPGDTFTATIKQDASDFYKRLPAGTRIEGVVKVAKAKKDKDPGILDLDFKRLRFPNGRSYPIQGTLFGLDNKSVDRSDDGRLIAKKTKKNDRLTYVGIGAAAGLVASLFTKNTFRETALGAGLGYLYGALEKSDKKPNDVSLKAGTEMGVRLERSVTLSNYEDTGEPDRLHRNDTRPHVNPPNTRRNDNAQDNSSIAEPNRSTADSIGVLVDDKNVEFDSNARPLMQGKVVLIPLRSVMNAVDTKFNYDSNRQSLTTNYNGDSIRVSVGSRIAIVGNRRVRLEAPVQKLNGTIYVPMRFFALATGRSVSWDAGSQTVILTSKRAEGEEGHP